MKLFWNKKEQEDAKKNIIFAELDEKMEAAMLEARRTFKYFWREVYWEYKRIIPANESMMIKVAFQQIFAGEVEPVFEHMWINQISFDGDFIRGILINQPNQLTNVAEGDSVTIGINDLSDWVVINDKQSYGGFTIQAMRSDMTEEEKRQHDAAWGLDFGDCHNIQLVYEQKEHPENLIEHPMSANMVEQATQFLTDDPEHVTLKDEYGLTMLHNEAIAGNKSIIEVLLQLGADKSATTNTGKTALDYAKSMGWEHIISILE